MSKPVSTKGRPFTIRTTHLSLVTEGLRDEHEIKASISRSLQEANPFESCEIEVEWTLVPVDVRDVIDVQRDGFTMQLPLALIDTLPDLLTRIVFAARKAGTLSWVPGDRDTIQPAADRRLRT